jgi:N-methylhydantoinase A
MRHVGIDVGGTFTDLFAYDDVTGQTWSTKVPTTVDNQARGVLASIAAAELTPGSFGMLAHGTTTGLNALIERGGAVTGLLTTEGFTDVIEIMRTDRASGYDLSWRKPKPYVQRRRRLGLLERVRVDGSVETPLDEDHARRQITALVDAGVEAIAVSLLHAYANPAHELRVKVLVEELAPGLHVSLSSDVNAEVREFERTNTVVIDAYIKPIMVRYIDELVARLQAGGFDGRLLLMQGSGGMVPAERASARPIVTLSSGPAAGAIAAAAIASAAGAKDVVTFDVGGTSTDVALIRDGKPFVDVQMQVEWGLPARVPMVDVSSVGAGGGSIGWIDQGGLLKMGPQSAGATPGPVSYGNGGTQPTLSDALLLKGLLGGALADGRLALDADTAQAAVQQELAGPLGLDADRVTEGMIQIAQANMANAVRSVSVWKGIDPRDLTLVAFGGAGGLVAAPVAEMLDIPRVLIPTTPGNACAMGTLMADVQEDRSVAFLARSEHVDIDEANRQLDGLGATVAAELVAQGLDDEQIEVTRYADLRYEGQIHELQIELPAEPLTDALLRDAVERFEQAYEAVYTIRLRTGRPEFVSLRARAISRLPHWDPPAFAGGAPGAEPLEHRDVLVGDGRVPVPVYERYDLPAGTRLQGPVILVEAGSTTWVAPGMCVDVDARGNLVIHVGGVADDAAFTTTSQAQEAVR